VVCPPDATKSRSAESILIKFDDTEDLITVVQRILKTG
jgi:hypothetical protein